MHRVTTRGFGVAVGLLVFATTVVWIAGDCSADIVEVGTDARFIRVTNNGTVYRPLHIGEIEGFLAGVIPAPGVDNANDVALLAAGASYESSVGTGGHGLTTAVYDGVLDAGGATWTKDAVGAEYVLDLGQTRDMGNVRVWQRNDTCCQDRLSDFTVSLLADNGSGLPGAEVFSESHPGDAPHQSYASISTVTGRFIRPGGPGAIGTETFEGTSGAYIRIQTDGSNSATGDFHVGEIEAFAPGVTPGSGLDPNDLALASKGAAFSTVAGVPGHGSDSAVVNGLQDTGGATWDRKGAHVEGLLSLGQTRELRTLRVWQRGDCCYNRLANFTVSVEDGAGNTLFSEYYPGQPPDRGYAAFSLPDQFTITGIDTLQIELDADADTADLLSVGADGLGALTIQPGATLEVTLYAGTVGYSDTFNILDFGSIAGTFDNMTLPDIGGLIWNTADLYVGGTITAVPEPATICLLALGGLAALVRRRKKL